MSVSQWCCRKLKATGLLAADEYEPLEEDSDCSSDEEEPSMEQAVRDIKALERSPLIIVPPCDAHYHHHTGCLKS